MDKTNEMKKFFKRLMASAAFPLISLHAYWRDLEGDYSGMQFIGGVIIAMGATVAFFLCFPVAKKVERGSIIWTLGLIVGIFVPAVVILGSIGEPKVWGRAVAFLAIGIPGVYMYAQRWDKPGRSLFQGPARWNKVET